LDKYVGEGRLTTYIKFVDLVISESRSSIQFKDVEGGQYMYHRGLEDTGTLVSGTIKIKPGESKPSTVGNGSSMVHLQHPTSGLLSRWSCSWDWSREKD
jgi:hypothetical protein